MRSRNVGIAPDPPTFSASMFFSVVPVSLCLAAHASDRQFRDDPREVLHPERFPVQAGPNPVPRLELVEQHLGEIVPMFFRRREAIVNRDQTGVRPLPANSLTA